MLDRPSAMCSMSSACSSKTGWLAATASPLDEAHHARGSADRILLARSAGAEAPRRHADAQRVHARHHAGARATMVSWNLATASVASQSPPCARIIRQ